MNAFIQFVAMSLVLLFVFLRKQRFIYCGVNIRNLGKEITSSSALDTIANNYIRIKDVGQERDQHPQPFQQFE